MKKSTYPIIVIALCIVQCLLSNFLTFSYYLSLSLMPLLILSLPPRCGTSLSLILAFVMGFAVDFLASSTLGLTSAALLAVALLRIPIFRLICGDEYFAYPEDTPASHQSFSQTLPSLLMAYLLYFILYVWIDSAGTRPLDFCIVRVLLSSIASSLLALLLSSLLFRRLS